MADDAPPEPAPIPAPPAPERVKSSREIKAERVAAARDLLGRGYAPDQVISWLERPGVMPDGEAKPWTCGRSTARAYVDLALESIDGEVTAPKGRKQARTRAMLTMMFQRAAALALDPKHAHRAAQLITAAVAAADKIARIDGAYAYDGALLLPAGGPIDADEAVRIVAHAQATLELAMRRKALAPTKPAAPPVVAVDAVEVDGDDEPDELLPEPAGDAN